MITYFRKLLSVRCLQELYSEETDNVLETFSVPEIYKITNKTKLHVRDNFLGRVANLSGDIWMFLILLFFKLANFAHNILVFSAKILSPPVVEIFPVKPNSVQLQPVFMKSTIS